MDKERMNASRKVSIGLSTVMCFVKLRFQAKRKTNVLMRIARMNVKSSTRISDWFLALKRSLIIVLFI